MHGVKIFKGSRVQIFAVLILAFWSWVVKIAKIWTARKFSRSTVKWSSLYTVAVIEHVRDGSTLRAILVPSYQWLTVAMSGIKVTKT